MSELIIFFSVALISFVGSLQLGAVNLVVIQTTLNRNLSAGILVAIGGAVPEIIYSSLALKGLYFLQDNQAAIDILNLSIIPVFLIIGLINIFQKTKPETLNKLKTVNRKINFFKGFSLGMLNPQLLPFWFFVLIYLDKYFIISSLSSKYAFILGAAAGAFGILFLFAVLVNYYQSRIEILFQRYSFNLIVGYFFVGLAALKFFKLFI